MIIYGKTKPVFRFNRQCLSYNYRKGQYDYNYILTQDSGTYILEDDLRVLISKPITSITTIPDNAKLYFDESSSFPRFKLSTTTFKRCIKETKADVIVLNYDKRIYCYNYYSLYITPLADYIGPSDELTSLAKLLNIKEIDISEKQVRMSNRLTSANIAYLNMISNSYTKPVITDDDLNKIIDKMNPTLTQDDYDQLNTMITSKDEETVGLGLKLLTNYNIAATPCAIRYLLHSTHDCWKWNSVKTSVAFKNLLSALDITYFQPSFPSIVYHSVPEGNTLSKEDKELLNPILIKRTEKYINSYCGDLQQKLNQCNININIDVKINE